jgi:DNA-directed RNA polymerase subunit M/transcription elongation factor TFIIS
MPKQSPNPELLPASRPRCTKCQTSMLAAPRLGQSEGVERGTLHCPKCGQQRPFGESSIKTYVIHEGRLVPKPEK